MSDNSSLCCLPFIHLSTHPHGGVTLCCVSDHTNAMNRARNIRDDRSVQYLDLNYNSVDSIMNSDYFQSVRQQMMNNERPPACNRCYKQEENGIRSKRQEENARFNFDEEAANAMIRESSKIDVNFKFIELRLGNLCNVQCRTCNPASSTKWVTDYKKLSASLPFMTVYDQQTDSRWTESDRFWDDLLEHSKNVELIYINGGEPTLVEKHWGYLRRLIDAGLHTKVTLWYSINMTNLPDKLLDIWDQFKEVKIDCSIDDLYERNEYIRIGTKWNTVIANLDKLQSMPKLKVAICQTISIYNIHSIVEFHQFMAKRNLHVHMNFVHDPKFLSAANLPVEEKEAILHHCSVLEKWKIDALTHYLSTDSDPIAINNAREYDKGLTFMQKEVK